jgi:nucleoside-diphosphate-sugar epimerase
VEVSNRSKTISILGCGWLGLPLAKTLLAKGWQVKGSTTTPQKLQTLQETGIKSFLLTLDANTDLSDSTFFDTEVLFINVPPSRKTAQTGYLDRMKRLLETIQKSPVKKVIFISSTSVYGDVCREVSEADEPDQQSELLQAEMLFLSAKKLQTTVIRFGGLFGPDRNPGRFFRDKQSIPNGLVPVNLIHLKDCIGLVEAVLNQQYAAGVYNAVAPSHPTKQAFYGKAITRSGFEAPEFVAEKTAWKIINAEKITTQLNYQFQYPDLLKCLDDPDAF